MKKEYLQVGMVVELFNGDKCLVLDTDKGKILVDDSTYLMLSDYDDDLKFIAGNNESLINYSVKAIYALNLPVGLNTLFNKNYLRLICNRKHIFDHISERKISKDEIRKAFDVKPYENITIVD